MRFVSAMLAHCVVYFLLIWLLVLAHVYMCVICTGRWPFSSQALMTRAGRYTHTQLCERRRHKVRRWLCVCVRVCVCVCGDGVVVLIHTHARMYTCVSTHQSSH